MEVKYICKKCGTSERNASGHCKKCKTEYNLKYRINNIEKCNLLVKDWRDKNRNKINDYLAKTKDHRSERDKHYHQTKGRFNKIINPVSNRLSRHNRRIVEKRSRPVWNNEFYMREAFELAILREDILGIKYHVDHIIPLRSKICSGLHAHTNLAVVPGILNIRKQCSMLEIKPY